MYTSRPQTTRQPWTLSSFPFLPSLSFTSFSFILSLLVCLQLFLWIRSDLSRGQSNPSITSNLTCVCVEVHVSGAVPYTELFMRRVYSISFTPAATAALPHQRSTLPSLSDPLLGANLQFDSHHVSMFHVWFMGECTDVMCVCVCVLEG